MKLKFSECFETEVFHTSSGHIRIIQHRSIDNTYTLLTPEQAEKLLTVLPDMIELARLELAEGGENE